MAEAPSDWKVKAVIDRKALGDDIIKQEKILISGKVECIVSATSEADAIKKAEGHFEVHQGISPAHVKAMYAKKLPT